MKRDLDLIRSILLEIERSNDLKTSCTSIAEALNHDVFEISHHVNLLLDAGYLIATPFKALGYKYNEYCIKRITNQGYDYLDSVRDEKVYSATKKALKGVAGFSLEIVKETASSVIKSFIGI